MARLPVTRDGVDQRGLAAFHHFQRAGLVGLHGQAEAGVADLAGAQYLLLDPIRHLDGDRKGHTLVAPGPGKNLRIDAHHFTAHVDQGAARVAWVNGHIGLNKRHKIFLW